MLLDGYIQKHRDRSLRRERDLARKTGFHFFASRFCVSTAMEKKRYRQVGAALDRSRKGPRTADAMRKTAACAALALFTAVIFCAAETRAAAPAPEPTLHGFGRHNADCIEWMNGCAVCRRFELAPARAGRPWSRRGRINFACSTPGIACQPGAIVCLLKKPS